jgi:hypothetical protein
MKYLIIFLTFILFSCNDQSNNIKREIERPKIESKFENLLKKYKSINIDTLVIYSMFDDKKFEGIRINRLEGKLFPKEIIEQNFINHELDIFACYKFNIDTSKIGLITRTPSMYSPTSIKLFIYDINLDAITKYIEVAETWGDAGDSMEKKSWVILNKNKFKILIEKIEKTDHRAYSEDENDTIIEIWKYYYLVEIKKSKFDTINKNGKYLMKKHFKLINKTSY